MNNEIKEMIDNLKFIAEQESATIEINQNGCKLLLDYITNLQEKVNMYENPDDMTLFYMWLDEKAKDKIKQLQEQQNQFASTINELGRSNVNLQERCEYLQRSCERKEDEILSLRDECVDGEMYKSRNEKAIKYIKQYKELDFSDLDLLHILQGDDKE